MPALQAYMLAKMVMRGMAALPISGTYVMMNDHVKTVAQWTGLANTWLSGGVKAAKITGGGGLDLQNGSFTIKTATCKTSAGVAIACTVSSTLKLNQSGEVVANGTRFAVQSGALSITSSPIGTVTYTPTHLLVLSTDKTAQLIGDLNLTFSFTGTGLKAKVTAGSKISATYSLTAWGN